MKFKYESYTDTIRSVPENYWLASIENRKLVFDSWETEAKKFNKLAIFFFYIKLLLTGKL